MSLHVLDPTHEGDALGFQLAPRLGSLQGATVGLISNGKKGTKPFFDAIERELIETQGVAQVVRAAGARPGRFGRLHAKSVSSGEHLR